MCSDLALTVGRSEPGGDSPSPMRHRAVSSTRAPTGGLVLAAPPCRRRRRRRRSARPASRSMSRKVDSLMGDGVSGRSVSPGASPRRTGTRRYPARCWRPRPARSAGVEQHAAHVLRRCRREQVARRDARRRDSRRFRSPPSGRHAPSADREALLGAQRDPRQLELAAVNGAGFTGASGLHAAQRRRCGLACGGRGGLGLRRQAIHVERRRGGLRSRGGRRRPLERHRGFA